VISATAALAVRHHGQRDGRAAIDVAKTDVDRKRRSVRKTKAWFGAIWGGLSYDMTGNIMGHRF
jgi:hypothetical protein